MLTAAPPACARARALAALLLLGLTGCAASWEYAVVGTRRAPGADGVVQVEEIEGGNRLVTVVVSNLLPPRRLGRELSTYVVWLSGSGGPTAKAGILDYDERSRQGNMFATTPHHDIQLEITAEREGDVSSPGDVIVVRRHLTSR